MKNVIIGFAYNYTSETISPFLDSLDGYEGELVLFVNGNFKVQKKYSFSVFLKNPKKELNKQLFLLGFLKYASKLLFMSKRFRQYFSNSIFRKIDSRKLLSKLELSFLYDNYYLATIRFPLYYNVFLDRKPDAVFMTDVSDVIFQGNVFEHVTGDKVLSFGEREDLMILNQHDNLRWIKSVSGSGGVAKVGNKPIICSGTILAPRDAAIKFISDYTREILSTSFDRYMVGIDQGFYNHMIYSGKYEYFKISENGNVVYTIGTEPRERIQLNGKQIVPVNGGIPSVVHQYNRHPDLVELVRSKS